MVLVFLFIIIIAGIICGICDISKEKQEVNNTIEVTNKLMKNNKYTKRVFYKSMAILANNNSKEFCVINKSNIYEMNFSDMTNFVTVDDGNCSGGSLGGAVAGGLMFGTVGAIVGANSGAGKCSSLQIRIRKNDIQNPEVVLTFIDTPTNRSDLSYKNAYNSFMEFAGLLSFIENNK